MRRLLTATAAAAVLLGGPAMGQMGGGDGAQVGANAYCGARAAGRSHEQAQSSASWAMSANMQGGSLSSGIASIIVGGRSQIESMNYLITKQCPELLSSVRAQQQITAPGPSQLNVEQTEYGGIGVKLQCWLKNGKVASVDQSCDAVKVYQIANESPAQVDGRIRVGDSILEVDNQLMEGKSAKDVGELVRGKVGTYIIIVINAAGKPLPILLKRASSVSYKF